MKIHNPSFDEFPKTDSQKWKSEAQKLLKGENKVENLIWSYTPEISLKPYYDQSDLVSIKYIYSFFSNLQKKRWIQYENVKVQSEQQANQEAKAALLNGCEGILFKGNLHSLDFDSLLQEILLDHCHVSFIHSGNEPFDLNGISGLNGFGLNVISSNAGFRDQAFVEDTTGSIVERSGRIITNILTTVSGHKAPDSFFENLVITLSPNKDFFHEIARLRALRLLIGKIAAKYGVKTNYLHIHSAPQKGTTESHHLLQQTTIGLASIIGGADSIAFNDGEKDWSGKGSGRISRNIGNLLRHESRLSEMPDACAGSYFIDSLTDQMTKSIWKVVNSSN